jgi:digeranylgeranylglycerophospholipid reductase
VGLGIKRQRGGSKSSHPVGGICGTPGQKERQIKGKPLGATGGLIPATPLKKAVYGNILLAGDAAGHTHPITGAGVFTAVSCGRMAGSWAAQAIQKDAIHILSGYDREWRDLFGRYP